MTEKTKTIGQKKSDAISEIMKFAIEYNEGRKKVSDLIDGQDVGKTYEELEKENNEIYDKFLDVIYIFGDLHVEERKKLIELEALMKLRN